MSNGAVMEFKDATDSYLSQFEQVERDRRAKWLLPIRKSAISTFAEMGFPTTADEEWRFTNVAPIAETVFEPARGELRVDPRRLAPYLFDKTAHLIVFVNGVYSPDLSSIGDLPPGVRVLSLAAALESDDRLLHDHLFRHVKIEGHPFTALNTALAGGGAVVHVPRGLVVERPIHALFLSAGENGPLAVHPHNLFVVEESGQATIMETYAGLSEGPYFTNAVSELVAQQNATLDHYKIVREGPEGLHIGTTQLHQFRDSNAHSFVGSFDGLLTRNDLGTVLDGEGCDCGLNGLYMVAGKRQVDNHLVVEHAKAHCDSREYFKGILDGQGKGIFSGRIIVRPGAQKTDAKQTNASLLLSQDAQVESKPQLEIFADDVKCTHGATIGQLDKDAMFYLRARGIHKDAAQSLMVYAFANDVLERVQVEPLRSQLVELMISRLPQGDLLRQAS